MLFSGSSVRLIWMSAKRMPLSRTVSLICCSACAMVSLSTSLLLTKSSAVRLLMFCTITGNTRLSRYCRALVMFCWVMENSAGLLICHWP